MCLVHETIAYDYCDVHLAHESGEDVLLGVNSVKRVSLMPLSNGPALTAVCLLEGAVHRLFELLKESSHDGLFGG